MDDKVFEIINDGLRELWKLTIEVRKSADAAVLTEEKQMQLENW